MYMQATYSQSVSIGNVCGKMEQYRSLPNCTESLCFNQIKPFAIQKEYLDLKYTLKIYSINL